MTMRRFRRASATTGAAAEEREGLLAQETPFSRTMAEPKVRLAWLASEAAYELGTQAVPSILTLIDEGFAPQLVEGARDTIALFWNAESSTLLIGFRGTVPNLQRDRLTDYMLAFGRLAYTERATKDREALRQALASFSATGAIARHVIFAGHSLGGTLAVEFLSNLWCNNGPIGVIQHPGVIKEAIVFNPGWAVAPKHYQFLPDEMVRAVTVLHIKGDTISKFIAEPPSPGKNTGGLRARLHKFGRVFVYTPLDPAAMTKLAKHSLKSFQRFLVNAFRDV